MKLIKSSIMMAIAVGVCACTPYTASDEDGNILGDVNFPEINHSFKDYNDIDGSFVNWNELRLLQPGLSKYQIMDIIGPPHYFEGFFAVREWNYVLNRWVGERQVEQCQLKILFADNNISSSYHWNPVGCNNNFEISSDLLFNFNSAVLLNEGKRAIDMIIAKSRNASSLTINGYSDPIGKSSYNRVLSQRRADVVKNYMQSNGFNGRIIAIGRGENSDRARCENNGRGGSIQCNKPNRRVEFIFN